MITLHALISANKSTQSRVGRGIAAGRGKTAGRGTKGQKSRAGYNLPRRFEGGQTPLTQRMPKRRGFKHFGEKPVVIDVADIERAYKSDETVSPETLLNHGLIKSIPAAGIKIIGNTKLTKNLSFEDVKLSSRLAEIVAKSSAKQEKESTSKPETKTSKTPRSSK